MIPINPGNLLKFNDSQYWQRHNQDGQNRVPFGLRAPNTRLIPFQVFIAIGASVVTWKLVNPVDPTGATDLAMTAGDLDLVDKDGGGTWITWGPGANLSVIPDCGFWEIWLDVDGIVYYSEVLHLFTAPEIGLAEMRFDFDNDNVDKGDVLYQQGHNQHFYPTKWAWDRSNIIRETQITEDGNGNETTRFSRTVARFRLEVADIPDYCIPFFAKCGDIAIVKFENSLGFPSVTMENVLFETKIQGLSLNIGVFTFDAEVESFNGCQENFVLA